MIEHDMLVHQTNSKQSHYFMSTNKEPSVEQRTLLIMRKLLTTIVRESTPQPGMKHTLSDDTRQDIRMCLGLISSRERELAEELGIELNERPYYADTPKKSSVVSIDALKKKPSTD